MSFNPDPHKQAQEVIFSRKLNKLNHPSLNFNNTVVIQLTNHKHLVMILVTKLDFQEHLKDKLSKISKTIGLLRKLPKILARAPMFTIYKSFIRPHLDHGDIIYDKAYNSSFHQFSACNNRSYRRNFQRKTFPRYRIRISQKKTMISKT